ncbi:MAG: hypothetical protein IJV32_05345 [Bacteroidales bacterium]|nr:hypothetical protein [Bacteroidales bacterium]
MSRITEQQEEILESFSIERLSSSDINLQLVGNFSNPKSESLTNKIQSEAFEEDENGSIAYYVIKNKEDGGIVFYFSLKCGQLYDKLIEKEQLRLINNLFQYFDEIEKEDSTSEEDRRLIKEIRESVRTSKGVSKADLDKIQKKDNKAVTDIENIFTENLQRVGQTFAGIEIVQFCANENYRKFFDSLGFFPHFGAVVFWRFLVPIVLEVRKHIGCQYLFLFAADTSDDESLIRYYRTLRFTDAGEHGAVIPLYDWTCRFMYQEISGLPQGKEEFFGDFNRDEEDV